MCERRRPSIHSFFSRIHRHGINIIITTTTATTLTRTIYTHQRRFQSDAVCCLPGSMSFRRSYIYVASLAIEHAENFVGRLLTNFTVWFTFCSIRTAVYVTSAGNSDPATRTPNLAVYSFFFLSKWKNLAVSSWIMDLIFRFVMRLCIEASKFCAKL